MASATVNGATMAVSYVGNGGGTANRDDSSPDGGQFSLYDEPEPHGHPCHHHHHHSKELLAEEDDVAVGDDRMEGLKTSVKRPATVFDTFTIPSAEAAMSLSKEKSCKKRRKQSNPVRLATSRLCSAEQEVMDFELDSRQDSIDSPPPTAPPSSSSSRRGSAHHIDKDEEADEGEVTSPRDDFGDGSIYRCSHCNVLFGEEEHLREHVEEEHVQKVLERQLQQQNQKNQREMMASSGSTSSNLNASPFDLSASSMAFRLDGRTSDSSSSEPSMHEFKHEDSTKGGSASSHHAAQHATSNSTTIPCTSAAVALHSPKDMASLMALSAFGAAPFLIPVLPCGNSTSASAAASSRIMSYTPMTTSSSMGSVTNPTATGPPIRIFNPEAFCELCNKEFCNKYFLKTHKANKHGIYSLEALASVASTTATTPTATQVASYTGSLIAAAAAAANMGATPVRPHLGESPASGINDGNSSNGNSSVMATAPTSGGSAAAAASMAGVLLGPSLVGKVMPVMNPEAFCDICQKEFCNKYFLKKHRQKIHGIQDFSLSSTFGTMASSSSSISALVDAIPITAAELSPGNANPGVLTSGSATHPATPSDLYYEFGARDLSAKILAAASQGLLSKHSIQNLVAAPTGGTNNKGITSTTAISPVPASHFNSGTSSEQASGNITVAGYSFSPEHLREMGVINVDAFCELCCKEFCNKYFLRTHKQNKHGIGYASYDCPAMGGKNGSSLTHQQSAPLSLVMEKENRGEDGRKSATSNSSNCSSLNGSTNGHHTADRLPLGSQELTQESTSVSLDLTCDVCSRPFSSAYLLKMHKFYFHNIDPSPPIGLTSGDVSSAARSNHELNKVPRSPSEASEGRCGSNSSLKSMAEINEVVSNATTGCGNEDLQKLQTMIHELNTSPKDGNVKCNICFHEMKNKYFLRAHMMNEHGELHNEDEMSQSDDTLHEHLIGQEREASLSATAGSSQNDCTSTIKASPNADAESFCEICCKDQCSKYFLQTHMMTVHGIGMPTDKNAEPGQINAISLPVPLDRIKMEHHGRTVSPPQSVSHNIQPMNSTMLQQHQQPVVSLSITERPPMTSVTGRNFCEICNKELCNKYFMKTHMLKMHGINVDEKMGINGATIGGVTCDICQKELCSKYFLKVHKQNTHGIFEEPSMTKESYAAAAAAAAAAAVSAASMSTSEKDNYHLGNATADGNASDGGTGNGNRYFSHYTEVCPLCDRRFKSIKWLKTHVINDHADLAKENGLAELLGAECYLGGGNDQSPHHMMRIQHMSPRDYMMSADMNFGIKVEKASSSSSSATTSPNTISPFHLHLHAHHQVPSHRPLPPMGHMAENDGNGGATTALHHAGELGSTGAAAAAGTLVAASATMTGNNSSTTSSSPSSASSTCVTTATSTAVTGTGPSSSIFSTTRKPLGPGNGTRIYHCSYCSYSTRWLSNLYAHEKRHTGLSSEGEKRFCCRICHRAYRYNHSLQRHLVSHKATGILMKHVVSTQSLSTASHHTTSTSSHVHNPTSLLNRSSHSSQVQNSVAPAAPKKTAKEHGGDDLNPDSSKVGVVTSASKPSKIAPARVKKYRCSKCGAKYRSREQCLDHIHTHHNTRNRHHHGYNPRTNEVINSAATSVAAHLAKSPQNCPVCPFSCSNKDVLAAHLSKHHQQTSARNDDDEDPDVAGNDGDATIDLLSNHHLQQQHLQQLQNALGRSQLPMTYAVPQTPPTAGSFIMQPFLISQSEAEDGSGAKSLPPNTTFVPSLVYLPVSHKISETLTVAFTLSPA